jgi:alpha-1,3-glucosyltransferase
LHALRALQAALFVKLGVTVMVTVAVVCMPFLVVPGGMHAVFSRVFPTQRGLFEDYVANFWWVFNVLFCVIMNRNHYLTSCHGLCRCVSSLIIKWKRLLGMNQLLLACLLATLCGFLPAAVAEARRPGEQSFLHCLSTTSMAFFMFSYQVITENLFILTVLFVPLSRLALLFNSFLLCVCIAQVHEKSILMPLLPLTALAGSAEELLSAPVIAAFSMYPLLLKDKLHVAYIASLLVYFGVIAIVRSMYFDAVPAVVDIKLGEKKWRSLHVPPWYFLVGAGFIHLAMRCFPPPPRFPYLFDAIIVSWSFLYFAGLYVWSTLQQVMMP